MRPLVAARSFSPFLALVLMAALVPACGDSGDKATDATTTGGETTGSESTSGEPGETTEEPTTSGSTTAPGTTTEMGTSTTGVPGVCDGSMPATAFECMACTECGSWTSPVTDTAYPPAMVCMFEGIRDGLVVGAQSESCNQGKCQIDRLLTTGNGTLISQTMILDQMDQSMKFLGISELELLETAYFEGCLAAFNVDCTAPNTWFAGASTNVDMLVCP
jgi:hypothetical protein